MLALGANVPQPLFFLAERAKPTRPMRSQLRRFPSYIYDGHARAKVNEATQMRSRAVAAEASAAATSPQSFRLATPRAKSLNRAPASHAEWKTHCEPTPHVAARCGGSAAFSAASERRRVRADRRRPAIVGRTCRAPAWRHDSPRVSLHSASPPARAARGGCTIVFFQVIGLLPLLKAAMPPLLPMLLGG
ncbi:hypothetical protein HPB50_012621 [Hyalomma asiaticum]|uniref:Uncharacterized protein n=1 Tax=Hyalomma asiaticum TaxID=266040 RepID=A0ACB7S5V4_HYAAI|nr:hypothetical protein HPB50_012621 [Hyalomma asiaticum]